MSTRNNINNYGAVGDASAAENENPFCREAVTTPNEAGNLEMDELGWSIIVTGGEEAEEGDKQETLKPGEGAILPGEDNAVPEEQNEAGNLEIQYERFVNGMLGCLDELGNSQDSTNDEPFHGGGSPLDNQIMDDLSAGIQQPERDGEDDETSSKDESSLLELGIETSPEDKALSGNNGLHRGNLGDGEDLVIGSLKIEHSHQSCDGDNNCGGFENLTAKVEQLCLPRYDNNDSLPKNGISPGVSGMNGLKAEMEKSRQILNGCCDGNNVSADFGSSSYLIQVYHVNHSEVSPLASWSVRALEIDKFLKEIEKTIPQSQRRFIESDIHLPIPKNLREHRWLAKSTQAFELGTSGYSYEGDIVDKKMEGYGRLVLGDGRGSIEGKWRKNRLIELKISQFTFHSRNKTIFVVKRLDDYLLTMYEHNFVARVLLDCVEELDFTESIAHLVPAFFRKLTTVEILVDELNYERHAALNKFKSLFENMVGEHADPIIRANILIFFSKGSRSISLSDFLSDQTIPADLRDAAINFLDSENRYLRDSFMRSLLHMPPSKQLDLKEITSKMGGEGIERHRQMLISKCPSALPSLLSELQMMEGSELLYVTKADIDVFDHLVSQPCFEHYKEFFEHLVERFSQTLHKIRTYTPPSTVIPIMSPVYGFLFKSFWEIILEIIDVAEGYQYEDLLYCKSGMWKLKDDIKWPGDEDDNTQAHGALKFFRSPAKKSSLYHRSLEIQYKIIFQMLKHFSPETFAKNKKCDFNFIVLEQALSWWQKGLKMVTKNVRLAKRLTNISGERLVWLYILDHTIHNVFKDDPKYTIILKPYNSLLQGQISFVEKLQTESHESFRVLTLSIVKFVTSTAPYFRESRGKLGIDVEILVQQMWTFSTASQEIEQDPRAFSSFRDLIAEYNRYLSLRLFLDIEAEEGYFSLQISEMMHTFMRIVKTSLNKNHVPTPALVSYFRYLNDFLDDFKNIDFLAMWYVKSMFYDPNIMEKVDNKLSTTGNCSYRVIDIDKYVQAFRLLRHQPPDHYIIQIVSELLRCIETCLNKQWQSGDGSMQVAQLESTSALFDAVRRSFMYLKEQPDYVDFEAFKKESVDPFLILVNECPSLNDLKKRIDIVKESFWYIRKMDEIGVDQALMMFKNANTCDDSDCDKLLDCYKLYLSHYDGYIKQYSSLLSQGRSHTESLDAVSETLQEPKTLHFSKWTEEFKTGEIPILLAGLSAVWSILVSQDVSSAGKFLKPHCIQILCVMRLLSVDRPKGAENHLAQVLTGQGKSVILGLLSSILALTGHQVRVVCYSEYLSNRDQDDFELFFETFQITNKIEYGTFKDMAGSFLNPYCNGRKTSLRDLVNARVLNQTVWSSLGSVTTESKDTVLLIDEVDVFFSDKFYGNTYGACTTIAIDGLAAVQEKIWSLALSGNVTKEQIVPLLKKHIEDEIAAGNPLILELTAFLNKPGTFSLLTENEGNLCDVQYVRQSLFHEHLLRMRDVALSVARSSDDHWIRSHFMLNNEGFICMKNAENIYSLHCVQGYLNVFNYFRLKGTNYDSKNSKNYGYLNLKIGWISYARLPSQFKLLLGVSGTITDLGVYEKRGIESYKIHKSSILPSFFGVSNLKFDECTDFMYVKKVQEWLNEIYKRANQIVNSHRAVLIFFESDSTMNLFSKEYKGKFDRLNEITVNTDANHRDMFIDEAGLSCAVTLATREMGRGVDYKSSLSVEKNGGVHVIQTFYSIDIKEEIQIKGRTARKDNKGSYEMIICREHLIKDVIAEDDIGTHNYASLNNIRRGLSDKKGKTLTEKIDNSERDHITTMKYFGLA